MSEYTPSLKAIESAYVAQRTSKGTPEDRAKAEFSRGIAIIRGGGAATESEQQ